MPLSLSFNPTYSSLPTTLHADLIAMVAGYNNLHKFC